MNSSFLKKIAGLILLVVLAMPAQAQVQDPAIAYSNGKILLQQQKYDQAMAELRPVISSNSAYAPEANYLYALAAFKGNKLKEAYDMLLQLQNQHPNWYGMNEADYLLANVLLEQGEYQRGIIKLQELQGTPLAADAGNLKRFYLSSLNDRAAFEQLVRRFPKDKEVAQAFANKLIGGWYRTQDRELLETLVSRHNLDRSRYLNKEVLREKGYNVALLLPFQLNQDYKQTARSSQFVTDLYAGIKLAQDSLQKQDININLYTYDTGADTMSVKRVLDLPEMKQMDLIIGPLYKSTAKVAARYAAQNNINVINPLSQDPEMVRGNTNTFLFEASIATQARQAAAYAYQNFSPKVATILFEESRDDTTFARYYRQEYVRLGGKVRTYRKINSAQTTATATLFNGLNLQELGHIAIFSDKMTAAVNATSAVQSKAPKLPIITYDKWLEISQITLRQLDNLEVYFISPKYINKQNPGNNWFRKKYVSKYNLTPSPFAYAGFEMMYYFGQMLKKYGPQFNQQLQNSNVKPGVLYTGIGYADQGGKNEVRHDNQYVPITKLENLELIVVNPVF